MIENLFTEQTVLLDVEAKDWEEAVRRTIGFLVWNGVLEED